MDSFKKSALHNSLLSGACNHSKWWVELLIISVIILIGAALRIHHLGEGTIGHIEIYIPGIDLPENLSEPPPRTTLLNTISGTIAQEPHPPGYYMLMYAWTSSFGTNKSIIRLPSALFGLASILLIFILATLEKDKLAGILAAMMLALNGNHIYWSQTAKMYAMGCFLGLLSTILLVMVSRSSRSEYWQRIWQTLYLIVTLTGLATIVFFWLIFVTQILWVIGNNLKKQKLMPGLLQLQILIIILGTPFSAIAAYQYWRPSYWKANLITGTVDFLQFGFLLVPDLFKADPWANFPPSIFAILMIVFLTLVALFLLIVGVKSISKPEIENETVIGVPFRATFYSGLIFFFVALAFAKYTNDRVPSQTKLVLAVGLVPILMFITDKLLRVYWCKLQKIRMLLIEGLSPFCKLNSLCFLLATVPILLVLVLSNFVTLFAKRTTLLFVPFFLIMLSIGLASLIRQNKRWILLALIIIVFHTLSVVHFKQVLHHPTAYEELSIIWKPHLDKSDLIFIQKHWATTPIFYYLNANRYHFEARDYAVKVRENPDSRIWVLSFTGLDNPRELEDALKGFEELMSLDALRIKATLYQRP